MNSSLSQTEKDIVEELERLSHDKDIEAKHAKANTLIMEFLEQLGYTEIVEAYDNIEKWYA